MTILQPLFRWTGGKTKMRKLYGSKFWPEKPFNTFIDAFYGGGSMSHWVYEKYPNTKFVINDQNDEIIQLYKVIRDNCEDFIQACQALEGRYLTTLHANPEQQYLDRHDFYTEVKMRYINDYIALGNVDESAHLYFLMKTCFNGWWKVYNYSNGRYATPPGTLVENKPFIDADLIRQHSKFYNERCTILRGDFENVRPYITEDSYVYFDPPYRDSTTDYTDEGFTDVEQIRLCELFKYADGIGASVSLSNKEIGDGFFETHLAGYEMLIYDVKYTAGRGESLSQVKENYLRNFTSVPTPFERLFTFV